mmetsp:Transcript_39292/g.61241  ORF Transcript_39292/g.61241 Transcript_39292/m.61241 type:complete len:95 (+) Transcript_39292:235-519(+)
MLTSLQHCRGVSEQQAEVLDSWINGANSSQQRTNIWFLARRFSSLCFLVPGVRAQESSTCDSVCCADSCLLSGVSGQEVPPALARASMQISVLM